MDQDQQPAAAAAAAEAATAPVLPDRRASSPRILNAALVGALVLAVAGVGFAAGRMTAPAPTAAGVFPGGNGGQFPIPSGGVLPGGIRTNGGNGGPGGLFANGGMTVEGTVESISDTTLTLKTVDGQTIQIALDDSTTYHAQTDASADDVATGGKVLVRLNMQRGTGSATGMSAGDVTVVP